MKDAGIFLGRKNNTGIFLGIVLFISVTKNCGMTRVTWKICECANFVSNLLAYLISVASQCILSYLRLLL